MGGGVGTNALYFESSYALGDHLVLIGNCAGTNLKTYYIGELGAGYYQSFDNKYRFDIIGGYGIGKLSGSEYEKGLSFWGGYSTDHNYLYFNNYYRYMLQADFGIFNKIGEIGVSSKVCDVFMYNTLYEEQTIEHNFGITSVVFTPIPYQSYFFEPAFFFRFGFKHVKYHFCVGYSYPFGPEIHFWNNSNLSYGLFASQGITVDLFQKQPMSVFDLIKRKR